MKRLRLILACLVLISGSMVLWNQQNLSEAANTDSTCVDCHTNLKKLMKLIWKIEEMHPKSLTSEETSGEG